jgi:hypothetical protein
MFGFELAYIDPGSGSLIIQGAIATIVAGAIFFRGQIARLLPGRGDHDDSSTSTPASPTSTSTSTSTPTSTAATSSVDDAARGG